MDNNSLLLFKNQDLPRRALRAGEKALFFFALIYVRFFINYNTSPPGGPWGAPAGVRFNTLIICLI